MIPYPSPSFWDRESILKKRVLERDQCLPTRIRVTDVVWLGFGGFGDPSEAWTEHAINSKLWVLGNISFGSP